MTLTLNHTHLTSIPSHIHTRRPSPRRPSPHRPVSLEAYLSITPPNGQPLDAVPCVVASYLLPLVSGRLLPPHLLLCCVFPPYASSFPYASSSFLSYNPFILYSLVWCFLLLAVPLYLRVILLSLSSGVSPFEEISHGVNQRVVRHPALYPACLHCYPP